MGKLRIGPEQNIQPSILPNSSGVDLSSSISPFQEINSIQYKYIDRPVEVIKEVIIEKPVVQEKIVEVIKYKEVPVEEIKFIEKEVFVDRPVEIIQEKIIEIPKLIFQEKFIVPLWIKGTLIAQSLLIVLLLLT